MFKRSILSISLSIALASPALSASEIIATKVNSQPNIDGQNEPFWNALSATRVPIQSIPASIATINKEKQKGKYAKNWKSSKATAIPHVDIKTAHDGDSIYIYATWPDATMDNRHKPYKWEGSKDDGEYVTGKEREDRLALMFPISGPFSHNKLSGNESVVDVWQWKANRTNNGPYLHDKSHHYSKSKPKGKASQHFSTDGSEIYVSRPSDPGGSPYTSQKIDPFTYQGDLARNYVPKEPKAGDATDVKGKGIWKDGHWHLEIQRKLDTNHPETDARFVVGESIAFALAAFDRVGDHFHATSGDLTLKLAP